VLHLGLNLFAIVLAGASSPEPATKTLALARGRVCALGKSERSVDCLNHRGVDSLKLPAASGGRIVDVDAGDDLVCARTDAAAMACWQFDPLRAEADIEQRYVMEDVVDFAIGELHRCIVHRDGGVECWGNNDQGQVGDGTRRYRPSPIGVKVAPAVGVEVAGPSTCALLRDGTVACWGGNRDWGDADRLRPQTVPGLNDVVRLLPGRVALRRDGAVVQWDVDRRDGGFTPPHVVAPAGIDATDTCFVDARGDVSCSGYRLGGDPTPMGLSGVHELVDRGAEQCARDRDGKAWCWTLARRSGRSLPSAGVDDSAARIDGLEGVARVDVATSQACAITTQGRVSCWSDVVTDVPLKKKAHDVLVQGEWACALTGDGQWCWWPGEAPTRVSKDGRGRLFDGEMETICAARGTDVVCQKPLFVDPTLHSTPSPVVAMRGSGPCYLDRGELRCQRRGGASQTVDVNVVDARKVVGGPDRVCSLRRDGTLDCTELVVRTCETSEVGVQRCKTRDLADDLRGVVDFDVRYGYGCVVQDDGRTRCWPPYRSAGENGLFDVGVAGMRSVSVAGRNGCGVDASGHVWCWGSVSGPLGTRHRPGSVGTTPTRVPWLDR